MHKLLLMSVLLASTLIPALSARESQPRRGLERTVVRLLIFNFVYLLAVVFVYQRICW